MFVQCNARKGFGALIVGLLCLNSYFRYSDGFVLSKSKITMCVKDSNMDPYNVVEGKKCEKKLVITKAVSAGEKPTEMLYVNVSKVEDEVDREEARLYNPFIITITKSPMHLIYPYHFVGTVNNKPYETSKREYWCQDGAKTKDASDFSCPVQFDKTTGERIWDSQGNRYHRGNTVCGNLLHIPILHFLFKNRKRQSAHCMKYSKLWYNVYEISQYSLMFKIFVKAYDLVEEEKNGRIDRKLVDGGKITLSNYKKSGHGIHGRILATLNGNFEPDTQFYSLAEKYLLIPMKGTIIHWDKHPQTRNGAQDYLIVPRSYVALHNSLQSCDKIGVSFTAFRMQGGHDGQGVGCNRKMGSCLANQIKDFFEEDTRRRNQGKRPLYFPEKYGKVIGTREYASSGAFALVYRVTQVVQSLVTLEISADDIILIYNRATGIIVKAFATDFESLSRDGRLHVVAQNTGLVTADFYVTISYCSRGILRDLEKKAAINPQKTHMFSLDLRTTVHASSKHMCTVKLWDARHKFLDSANVSFETTKSCVCLQSCNCACSGTADNERCIIKGYTGSREYYKFWNVKLQKKTLNNLARFFKNLNANLDTIVFTFTKPTLGHLFRLWLFISLLFGLFKARLGIQPGGTPIAYFGWWWDQPVGEEVVVDGNGLEVKGKYNRDGELIHPETGKVLKSEKLLLFVGNIFFFLLLLCILGVRAARFYKELEKEEVTVSISSVALTSTTVYRNFTEFPDADNYFTNPGTNFSLAGKLQQIESAYRFVVVDNMQVVEVVDDAMYLLTPAVPFDTDAFSKLFNEDEALQEITLQPMYLCLNEEPPTLDYYSDNEQPATPGDNSGDEQTSSPPTPSYSFSEPPPTPPTPDYPANELPSPCNNSIYEKPVEFN